MVEERRAEEVVLAAIVDGQRRVLVQPRVGDPALGGSWELPGGKIEAGEDHAAALAREVEEETGLLIRVGGLALALCHEYPDRRVALYAYLCHRVGGARPPRSARWVGAAELRALPMPEANAALLPAVEDAIAMLDTNSSNSYR